MEKINIFQSNFPFKEPEKKKKEKTVSVKKGKFEKVLKPMVKVENTEVEIHDTTIDADSIEELLDEVYRKGEELKRKPSFGNIKRYRKQIKHFLKYIIDNMIQVDEKSSGINILKRKRFTLINIIDNKLENLAAEVLRMQVDQLNILKKVDEINGLIIDLLK